MTHCTHLPQCLFIWIYTELSVQRNSLCKVILSGGDFWVVTKEIKLGFVFFFKFVSIDTFHVCVCMTVDQELGAGFEQTENCSHCLIDLCIGSRSYIFFLKFKEKYFLSFPLLKQYYEWETVDSCKMRDSKWMLFIMFNKFICNFSIFFTYTL